MDHCLDCWVCFVYCGFGRLVLFGWLRNGVKVWGGVLDVRSGISLWAYASCWSWLSRELRECICTVVLESSLY